MERCLGAVDDGLVRNAHRLSVGRQEHHLLEGHAVTLVTACDDQDMPRTTLLHLAAAALGAALLTGCSAAEDVASQAGDAAKDAASTAAVDAVQDQICAVVKDNQVSEQDLEVLRGLVDTAQAAGVESDVLTALEDVTGTDGTPPESAVADLAEACRQ